MTKSREQLTDIGEWVVTDATKYIRVVALFADFEKLAKEGNTDAAYIINALHYVHKAMKAA